MNRIYKYIVLDILKNKIAIAYAVALALLSWSAFSIEDSPAKALLTLLNIILLTVPLVTILFTTIYVYNSNEFIELLVSQPIRRQKIWTSLWLGLAASLSAAFLLGAGLPILLFAEPSKGLMMIATGVLTTCIFVSLAFVSAIMSRDKARGVGVAILCWLFYALLFDGLVLFLLFQFSDYPIEKPMVVVSALNPIDLTRILILLQLDVSAMMGYTGAVFKQFFGTQAGLVLSFSLLLLWAFVPFLFSLIKFKNKDL